MRNPLTPLLFALPALLLFTGCAITMGGGTKTAAPGPTLGQQLIDLQTARNTGAISQSEYETLRAKMIQKN